MPFWPPTKEIHVTSAVAVQAQELSDGVTVNAKFPPAAGTVFDCGLRTKLHVPAVCVMAESANPPDQDTRIVPLRTAAVGLAAAVNVIVPGLVPAVAPTVIHGVVVDADQVQEGSDVLLVAVFDEIRAGVLIVRLNRLKEGFQSDVVADQSLLVDDHLVLLHVAAKTQHVRDAGHRAQLQLHNPILNRA